MAVKLGSKVIDSVTGFTGIVTGRCEYLTGTPRLLVESQALHEGKTVDGWFEESRLSIAAE